MKSLLQKLSLVGQILVCQYSDSHGFDPLVNRYSTTLYAVEILLVWQTGLGN